MKLEIEVISEDVISPSSATPDRLGKLKLSYLDQISPPIFMPLILFYPASSSLSNSEKLNRLKRSLSQVLSLFYPLAGRVIDNSYFNCNDEGVIFVEARANCELLDVISDPIPGEFNKFVPRDPDDVRDLCLVVQATFFNCGGLAVGVGLSHKCADGWSLFMFINRWAATSRGNAPMLSPEFISATLFPPRDVGGYSAKIGMVRKEDIVTKRFLFTAPKIHALRDKYTKEGGKEHSGRPTRIEALSAFIWTRFMLSTQAKDDPSKIYALVNAINLRTKGVPPLPQNYFGNISWPVIAVPSIGDDQDCALGVAEKVKEAIRSVDGDYVNKLREGNQPLNFLKDRAKDFLKGELVTFSFTSLCRFPLYDADFGWGKPLWVGSASMGFKNLVTFLDSLSGDGIEVWINMNSDDMAKFEADGELLAYVSSGHDADIVTI